MFLKSIRAQGFKSFADKLDLEINPGITGIVGPNGSGKSNIVDAVRWVLGEQSVKSLRGNTGMTDCIFSGSESREPQKRAMVALTFDNTDHALNSSFNEVEVKRVVYLTGENEYFLNNSRVRLKDITDLFIDSGAGGSAFNIISQGNITDVINSKPLDRRVIFESAAGVLKYKKRKEESLKKLEKTNENIMRVKLVIDELAKSVDPLREQSVLAKKYLDLKNNLERVDIALIANDITVSNLDYQKCSEEINVLKSKLENVDSSNDERLEKSKFKSMRLEEEINAKKDELLKLTEEISSLNSEKKLTIERQKYQLNSKDFDENLLKLKEESLNIEKDISLINNEILGVEENISLKTEEKNKLSDELILENVKRSNLNTNVQEINKELYLTQNKISILENNMLSLEHMPLAIKSVLNNPRLKGIHNTVENLIEIPDVYSIATEIALGASSNFIVVDNDLVAIEAIEFLKERKLGRATFLPLNIMKERNVPIDIIKSIEHIDGYIGVLSDLVKYDKQYEFVIKNQIGNILVVKDSTSLSALGKLVNYRYKVVSLDGEIINVGGSITGGNYQKNRLFNEKKELNALKEKEQSLQINLNNYMDNLKAQENLVNDLEEKESALLRQIALLNDELLSKKNSLNRMNADKRNILSELEGITDLKSNSLDTHLENLLETINTKTLDKEKLEASIKKLSDDKNALSDEITDLEHALKERQSAFNSINNELKQHEIMASKLEVKLDNLLENLNSEYNITYEYARDNYSLDMDEDIARSTSNKLKRELASLGNVNLGSIEEYERINTRYEFLNNQKDDLENASDELKSIISEMDEIMIQRFKETFDLVKREFASIFRLMFKGGKGELKLTNPDDLLNTGIDIIAIPPGKKINSPLSLSGGEKALTAICILFAILRIKPSPFVILDEAEAALDEVNVDLFGKYLSEEKKNSQFIVITHKKRMMEYADALYGITMQESGVSKIVSAKLES